MTTSNNKVIEEISERKLGQLGINEMKIWLTTKFLLMAKFQLEKHDFDVCKEFSMKNGPNFPNYKK
jgi:hypothetical protein